MPQLLPTPDPDTEGFWEGARLGELRVRRCRDCGGTSFPPDPTCAECTGTNLEWIRAAGTGRIYTWTRVHQAPSPHFAGDVPYVLVVVQLDDYPVRIPGRFKAAQSTGIRVDLPVRVAFDRLTPDAVVPCREPARCGLRWRDTVMRPSTREPAGDERILVARQNSAASATSSAVPSFGAGFPQSRSGGSFREAARSSASR